MSRVPPTLEPAWRTALVDRSSRPSSHGSLSRFLLSLSLAAVGIGLVGASPRVSHQRATSGGVWSHESSSGTVARGFRSRVGILDDDDREVVRRAIRRGENGTYISEILRARDSALARWPDRFGDPLRVWIQPRLASPVRVRGAFRLRRVGHARSPGRV